VPAARFTAFAWLRRERVDKIRYWNKFNTTHQQAAEENDLMRIHKESGESTWRTADARQRRAAQLVESGMTKPQAAKAMGVSQSRFAGILRSRARLDKAFEDFAALVVVARSRRG
jgi:hypothetical protein